MNAESVEQEQGQSMSRSDGDGAQGSSAASRGLKTEAKVGEASGSDVREVEWQFDAANLASIEQWLGTYPAGSGLKIGVGTTKNLTDTYYDTGDWVLYRAGYALRIRQRGKSAQATMKSLSAAQDAQAGLRDRREISEPLESAEVSALGESGGKVGERLRMLAGSKDLEKLFEVRTHRRVFEMRLEEPVGEPSESEVLGETALDESEVPLGRGEEPARLRRIEIEASLEAVSGDLRHFVEEIRSTHKLSRARISKYEAGLYATGLTPDDRSDLGPVQVDGSMSAGEVAYAVLRRQLTTLQEHEPGVRLGEDPEEVHDMRVASRRLRAAIKLFSEALPERALWLEGEVRWLAGELGRVRDLDVELEELDAWAASEQGDATGFEDLIEAVEEQRNQVRARMLKALDSGRYERLITSFATMLRRGPARFSEKGAVADTPITTAAPALLSRRYIKFRKAAKRITENAPPEAYHVLRKKGKSLRYALEFHREIYGSSVKDTIRLLKTLQDDLGRHQDAVVAADHLQELGTAGDQGLSSAAVFAMGAYAERYRREAAGLRAEIPGSKVFRTLRSRAAQKDLEKKLDKRR